MLRARLDAMTSLGGIYVPLITPFAADGGVDVYALEQLAQDVLADGASGIVALGTTAETAALDDDERRAVVKVCARVCCERNASLIVGAGSNDTRGSALALAELGSDVSAAMVSVPYFTRPTPAGVLAHFAALTDASPVPLIVYHVPYRTGLDLDANCLRALGRLPGVIGVKYSVGGIDSHAIDLLGDLPPGLSVLAGDDAFVSPFLALGAVGGILASAALATRPFVDLVDAWTSGDVTRARDLGHRLAALSAAAFAEPNPTVIKGVLHAQGRIPTPDVRLPLLPAGRANVDAALAQLGHCVTAQHT
jgi:4-hydroxy-tetrahydrodipicolinate synthase